MFKWFIKRFHLLAAVLVLLLLMFVFWLAGIAFEDYVLARVKEANSAHHWDLYTRFIYLATTYPVRSAIIVACTVVVLSEFHLRFKSHPLWKAAFGDNNDKSDSSKPAVDQSGRGIDVELIPTQGQSTRQFLSVANHGKKQLFRAQCKVVSRRNDPNPQRLLTFDLLWWDRGQNATLCQGESGNLLIAEAGETGSVEWIKIVGGTESIYNQWPSDSRGNLPEYDLEVRIFGDVSGDSHIEHFTV